MRRALPFLLFVLAAAPPARAQTPAPPQTVLDVAPTTLELEPDRAGLFFVTNHGVHPVTVQIEAMDWHQRNTGAGAPDRLTPSTTLLTSPPMARIAPLSGALTGDLVRYFIASVITFVTAYAMGYRPGGGLGGVAACILLVMACAWALSWIFALVGVSMKSSRGVQGIAFLILFPLTFLSNAFVPAETMPHWLQTFVRFNPVTHIINAARNLCNEGTFGSDGFLALVGAAVVIAIFAPLTVRKYRTHT